MRKASLRCRQTVLSAENDRQRPLARAALSKGKGGEYARHSAFAQDGKKR